jgi:GNAT superfamily N-acetyltransferase
VWPLRPPTRVKRGVEAELYLWGQEHGKKGNGMMDTEHFSIETDPTFEDVRFLEDRLYEYNVEKTGTDDGQWLAIFLRDAQQIIYAGLEGWTWCGSCYIRTVWVHKDLRGQGIGTKLLQTAEQEARRRGCQQMTLSSFSFQAPGFYQKLGYEVLAVLDEHPRSHQHYYLRKWLR